MSLIERNALHFSRVDSFDDDYEGFIPKNLLKVLVKEANKNNKNVDKTYNWGGEIDTISGLTQNPFNQFEYNRRCSYANCWNLRESESFALWKANLQSSDGVVIKSTIGNLKGCLQTADSVYISKVDYVDFEEAEKYHFDRSIDHPYLYKRNPLEYEQEVRALILDPPITGPDYDFFDDDVLDSREWEMGSNPSDFDWSGQDAWKRVAIDLEELIDEIRISPSSSKWQKKLIEEEIVEDLDINIDISDLSISREEFYDDLEIYESEFGFD
ncbi:hypothetical protein OB920_18600 [Halobacteria archaeon HArc-gm2]|nr:hypothetical protein [Halobacteria archaeon HArc-gm2]